jgi:hypothetical protein
MGENLLEYLKQVEDFRTKDGQRHQLWLVLLFIIMATCFSFPRSHRYRSSLERN